MSHVCKEEESVTIRPEMDIVASTANELRGELKTLIDEGRTHVIVDLEGVEMVDSVGLGVFIAAHNSLSQTGRVLTLANVSSDIMILLRTMRLDKHFTIAEGQGVKS